MTHTPDIQIRYASARIKKENLDKIERAYNLIDEVEYSKAKKIGEELISEGNLEGYFILTDIAEETEDLQVCVEILKGGIEEHKNWKLWMRLGNYESDLELFEDAEYSMDRALYMTDADQSLVKLNKAILLRRLKRFEESMKIFRECWEDYPVKSFCLELDILNELEQYNTIISKIDQNLFEDGYEHDYDSFSSALFYIANAYHKLSKRKEAEYYLNYSLDMNRNNENSLWLRRELFGRTDINNKYYQIMVNGDYEEEDTKGIEMEFLTWYDVISDSLNNALEEIKQFEPTDLNKESFKIEEYEILEKTTTDPSGIYQTSGFSICQKE